MFPLEFRTFRNRREHDLLRCPSDYKKGRKFDAIVINYPRVHRCETLSRMREGELGRPQDNSTGFFSTKTVVSFTPFGLVFLRLPFAVTVYSVNTEELAADATLLPTPLRREILSSAAAILLQGTCCTGVGGLTRHASPTQQNHCRICSDFKTQKYTHVECC